MNGIHHPDLKLDEPASSIDFEQLQYIIREKAWLIALCTLIGIFGGLAYIHRTPLTYFAQTLLEVDPQPTKMAGYSAQDVSTDPIGEEMGQTLLAMFKSRSFAEQVVKNYDLANNPLFLPPLPNGAPHTADEAINAVIGMSRVAIRPATRLIEVGATHSNPEMARQLADMIAKSYLMQAMQQQVDASNVRIEYLDQQEKKYRNKVSDSKKALQDYVSAHSGSLVAGQDTVVTDLKNRMTTLSTIHADRIRLEGDDEDVQKHINDPEALLAIPSVANHPMILDTKSQIQKLESSIGVLQLRYTEKHPKMIQARTELAHQQELLKENLLKIPALIHSAHEAAVVQEQKFQDELKSQQKATTSLNYDQIQYDVLSGNVDTDQRLYEGILTQLKQISVASGFESPGVHLFESAVLPGEAMQPRKSRTLGISLGVGLLLGILLSVGLHMMDSSLKTVDQAEHVLGLSALAAVPRQSHGRIKETSLSLVNTPGSPVAEAFRSLRTSIYLAGRSKGREIILFTSALAGEGKTFCSTNYAISLAQQGLRTLLIDADLRAPMIGNVLLKGAKLPGLGELLARKLDSLPVHGTEVENLCVMPAGELVPNPAELLARADMSELIRQVSAKFERIVIDTAPVTAVSDTLLLLEHAQAVCLVMHAGKTPRKWILRAIKLITEAGSKPVGIILNQVPIRMAGAYSYYPGRYGEPEVYGTQRRERPDKKDGPKPPDHPEIARPAPQF